MGDWRSGKVKARKRMQKETEKAKEYEREGFL